MGGVVREILHRARSMPVHVAVVIRGGEHPLDRIFAVIDSGPHGKAALDLALRVAMRKKSGLHVVLLPAKEDEADAELLAMIRNAGHSLGRRLHTDVLSAPSAAQLGRQTPGGLVVIATNLADMVGLSPEHFADGKRCVVVVLGSELALKKSAARIEEPNRIVKS